MGISDDVPADAQRESPQAHYCFLSLKELASESKNFTCNSSPVKWCDRVSFFSIEGMSVTGSLGSHVSRSVVNHFT